MAAALDQQVLSVVDKKGFVPDETRDAFFRKLRMKNENRSCFECTARNPTWISLTYGVYLCLECSGEHRRKGVHISFVRSVELDRFTPEQMVQMAVGGNGKALEHFKQHGMGKTSQTGRPLDYNSKIALRYKTQMEKESAGTCAKFGISAKPGSQALTGDPVDEATVFPPDVPPKAVAPASTGGYPQEASAKVAGKAVAKASAPTTVVVRKASGGGFDTPTGTFDTPKGGMMGAASLGGVTDGGSVADAASATLATAPATSAISAAKPVGPGFGAKQTAKELDFDFDFDELEAEVNKPAPEPLPVVGGLAAAPALAMTATTSSSMKPPIFAAKNKPAEAPVPATNSDVKFSGAKAISSDDFFQQEKGETAQAKMERESRYQKFAGAGAISSSSFFGDAKPEEEMRRNSTTDMEEWKETARRGGELAKDGIKRGAELIHKYLR